MTKTNKLNLHLHDSELITLHNDSQSESAELIFRSENGLITRINIYDVINIRCNNFGTQNIVYDVFISSEKRAEKDFFLKRLDWLYENKTFLIKGKKDEIWKDCENGLSNLICIEPSNGAELVILCSKFDIEI